MSAYITETKKRAPADKKLADHCKAILKHFKDYKACKDIAIDCAQCKIMIMLGYLDWMIDLLGYSNKSKKKNGKYRNKKNRG